MQRRGKLQRLRSKWGHVRHGVTNRVATTISNIRDKSYAYAGFPMAQPLGSQDESSDPVDLCRARYRQLRNTIVRALLVDEVTYEPSSRMKKSRKAVVLITGADLVLVKMTSMTKAGSTLSRASSTPADGAAGASQSSSAYAASGGGAGASRRLDSGVDAAAAVAADARASVLCQHELNKMVKCEVAGDRLDLEFIVTGGAQFKVSAAALGLNTANVSTLPSSSTISSSSMGRQSERLGEECEGLDAAAATADVLPGDAAEVGLGRRSGSGSGGQQQQGQASAQDRQQEHLSPRSSGSSPSMLGSRSAQAQTASAHDQGGHQDAPAASAASSSGDMDFQGQPSPGGSGPAALLDDSAYRANNDSFDLSVAPAATALGSRTLARFINRYSSYSSGAFPAGSPPPASGVSLSAAAGFAGKSFVRGLGSRTLGAADEGARSSCRPVKTDDGEYLVWVESFSLTFSNPALAEMAAELLRAGRSTMRQAIDWLKQGLPFSPEFAVTHITQLNSRAGEEELRAGPTPWNTVLQLPDSWVAAVSDAQLPDEQPLGTALEVADGPAAFKVHLATPAGLAEATLLPELIAVLSQQPCTHGQVLAVPVDLTSQVTAAVAQRAQEQQQQQVAAKANSTGSGQGPARQCRTGGAADSAGNASSSSSSKVQAAVSTEGSSLPSAAVSREPVPAADKLRESSQRELTWADQQQQGDGDVGADVAPLQHSTHGGAAAGFQHRAAPCGAASAAGKGMPHSRSMPQLGEVDHLLPAAASVEYDSCDETDLWAEQDVQQAQQVAQTIHLRRRADSSSSLPDLQSGQRGVSTDSWKGDGPAADSCTAGAASAAAELAAEEQRPGFAGLSRIYRQQSWAQLSFAAEVHAVLHVRLLLDTEDGSSSVLDASCAPAGPQISPFAVRAGVSGLDDAAMPLPDGSLQMQHTIAQQPSILLLGAEHTRPTAEQQQIVQTAVALLAALLCGCALLLRSHTGAASAVLVLCAALVNVVCMAAALHPALFQRPGRFLQRVLRLQQAHSSYAHVHSHHHHHHQNHHHHGGSHHGLKGQHSKRSTAGAGPVGQHSSGLSQQRKLRGLRLQLLGGSFVKEALGLLEQQINAYRDMQESPDSCSASYVSGSESDDLESASSEDEEMYEAVFVSSPEPAWISRDWRRRLWQARPTMEERSKLSGIIHAWRESVRADTILQREPAKFDWFRKHLVLRPLLKTQQGHMVVLLKLSTLANMHRMLTAAGMSPADLMLHCAFLWCWMFEEYAPGDWPQGRFVLLADMSGLKLAQAVGEGQIGGRALGEVCNAFPERLTRCLVLGAPNWFNMIYRLIRPQLSPSTRAKVQVCTTPAETVAELARCLGSDWVPAEYGGPCTHPYDEFPAQRALLQHIAQLRQQDA